MKEDLDPTRVMRLVDHPVRMKIIELLASRGAMTWKELSAELGAGTGSLYHHLDTLERIVARDSSKRYMLTPVGEQVYLKLRSVSLEIPAKAPDVAPRSASGGGLLNMIAPRPFLRIITSSLGRSVSSLLLLSALVTASSIYSGVQLTLFAFGPSQSPFVAAGSYVASLFAVAGMSYGAAALLFKQRPEVMPLLASSALSFLPMSSLSLVLSLLVRQGSLGILSDRTALTLTVGVFQAWSALLLSSGTSVASGLRIEKTLIIGLVLLYVSMSTFFIQDRIF